MRHYIFLIFIIFSSHNYAQNSTRLDSLINRLESATDRERAKLYNEISWEFRNSNVDSALVYAKKSLSVSRSINDKKSEAAAYNSIANSHEANSEIDSALAYHQKSLKLKVEINDTLGIGDTYNNIGIIYDTKGDYAAALKNYFNALKIYENLSNDFEKVPMVYINIGIVYKKQNEYQKVLNYYSKALEIYKKNNFIIGEVITTGNIGAVLINLQKYHESIEYLKRAKHLYDSLGYKRYLPYMDVNLGIAHDSLRYYQNARNYYIASVDAFKKDNNLFELANAQINFGRHYKTTKNFVQSKNQLLNALQIARNNAFIEMENKALKQLAEVETKFNNYKSAFQYYQQYAILRDSIFERDKVKTIFELETKYETEKKEREILKQRALLAEKEVVLQRRNYQTYGSLGLAVILGLIGYLFYNQQKLKNHQLVKENQLKDALVKIETQNKLQEQRLRISRDLHDNIGAQLTFVISSLDNLKYGFDLPHNLANKLQAIGDFTSETISELRDTIWAMNKSEISFEDLQSRIANYVDKANFSALGITFSFNVDDNVDKSRHFSSVEGMNIYRIIQESVNNALKYAEAKVIAVKISEFQSKLYLTISDDGIGFNQDQITSGNGLQNIQKRANEIGAEITILSEEARGTQIQLVL
jgi:signal transduction histidine kinase